MFKHRQRERQFRCTYSVHVYVRHIIYSCILEKYTVILSNLKRWRRVESRNAQRTLDTWCLFVYYFFSQVRFSSVSFVSIWFLDTTLNDNAFTLPLSFTRLHFKCFKTTFSTKGNWKNSIKTQLSCVLIKQYCFRNICWNKINQIDVCACVYAELFFILVIASLSKNIWRTSPNAYE